MKSIKHFINLSNGIEYIPHIPNEYSFIRIQSTYCEQKRWNDILLELDYSFLMSLALGHKCIVYDKSAKHKVPRAIWQGLEWVKYTLNLVWFNKEVKAVTRGMNVTSYFNSQFLVLPRQTIKKLCYFKKFLITDKLDIEAITENTRNDSKYEVLKSLLIDTQKTQK